MKKRLARHIRSQGAVLLLGVFAMLAGSQSASATVLTITLIESFGSGGAGGSSIDVILDDSGTNELKIKFDLTNLVDTGVTRVDQIYLSYDGNPVLAAGDFGAWTGTTNDTPTISVCASAPDCTTVNPFKADGDGIFDLFFEFVNSSTTGFLSGEMTMSTISLVGITVEDFIGLSNTSGGASGPFCMAAHIISGINTDTDNLDSDFIGGQCVPGGMEMPEPASLLLFGIGLLGLGVFARRRRFAA